MKVIKYSIALFFILVCVTSPLRAQVVPKLSTYDYMMGNGANTWFTKINAAIDSMNSLIDSLAAHRAMIYVAAGGSVDSLRLLPVIGSNKSSGGRLTLHSFVADTLKSNTNLYLGNSATGIGTLYIGANTRLQGLGGNGSYLQFDGSWADLMIYNHQDHGAGIWTTNSYPFIAGANLGNPDSEKDGVKALLMWPAYRASLYTQTKLSKFNVGGTIRSSDSLVGSGVYTAIAKTDSAVMKTKFFSNTGWIQQDSIKYWIKEVEEEAAQPYAVSGEDNITLRHYLVRVKYNSGYQQRRSLTIRSDSTNGICLLSLVLTRYTQYRSITGTYAGAIPSAANVINSSIYGAYGYNRTVYTLTASSTTYFSVKTSGTGSWNYWPLYLSNGDGNEQSLDVEYRLTVGVPVAATSTWYWDFTSN